MDKESNEPADVPFHHQDGFVGLAIILMIFSSIATWGTLKCRLLRQRAVHKKNDAAQSVLPVVPSQDSEQIDDDCPICLEKGKILVFTSCRHIFCEECILNTWRNRNYPARCVCPLCRESIYTLFPFGPLSAVESAALPDLKTSTNLQPGLQEMTGALSMRCHSHLPSWLSCCFDRVRQNKSEIVNGVRVSAAIAEYNKISSAGGVFPQSSSWSGLAVQCRSWAHFLADSPLLLRSILLIVQYDARSGCLLCYKIFVTLRFLLSFTGTLLYLYIPDDLLPEQSSPGWRWLGYLDDLFAVIVFVLVVLSLFRDVYLSTASFRSYQPMNV